ncbi:MAG: uridine diphosphate-N-acetylglucosamine-binding protein YvcK [bacterium]
MPKIKAVIIGGGNGSAITTRALKQNLDLFDISTVVSMSDSGGSSGRLRDEFKTLPPGDILRAILAQSSICEYKKLKTIFNKNRFDDAGKLTGHNLGNLFLILSEQFAGDYMHAVRALEQSVQAVGHVYPVTLDETNLIVELENGKIIRTEAQIDRPNYDKRIKIKNARLEPLGKIYEEANHAIKQADYIFLGPGSLYCSIIAALLPAGVKEAIDESKAKLIYVAGNAYEVDGETGPTDLSGFVSQLEKYLPRKLNAIVFNNAKFDKTQSEKYKKKKWDIIGFDEKNLLHYNIIKGDYEREDGGLCKIKLGKILKKVIKKNIF